MRDPVVVFWTLVLLALLGIVGWMLDLDDLIRASIAGGHLLDWVMGGLCLIWLLVILKAPWDLYFQAGEATFELQRSRERGIAVAPGREEYVRQLQRRLGWLAVAAHVASAALVGGVAVVAGKTVGYYFSVFYLVSTLFRPGIAGYVYLLRKLRSIGEEARHPRDDVTDLRARLAKQETAMRDLERRVELWGQEWQSECHELRRGVQALSGEFATVASRLTTDQEVINGIQALARLVARSAQGR